MKAVIGEYYQPAILLVSTLTIASFFALIGIDPHHHGFMLKPALDVAHGQMLFRDTITQYGALTTLLQALAIRFFGDYLMVIQIQTAIFYGLISVCLWFLWIRILPKWLTTASIVIWLFLAPYFLWVFLPWSSVYALFFQLFSLLLLLHAVHDENRLIIMFSGIVAVLTFWCRQTVGFFHCASLIFFLATAPILTRQRWKNAMADCAFFITGIIAASLPVVAWLALNDSVYDMYLQSIKAALYFGTNTADVEGIQNIFLKVLMALFGYLGRFTRMPYSTFIWSLLPLACLFLFTILAFKKWYKRDSNANHLPLYGLLVVSLFSWLQYYPVPCIRHCYWAATPMIGIFSYVVWKPFSHKGKKIQILAVCIILVIVFGFDIGKRFFVGFNRITAVYEKIEEPKVLHGMYVSPSDANLFKTISTSLNNAIQKNDFPYLVNLTSDPLYLTFIGPQNNYHPMYIFADMWQYVYPDFSIRRNEFMNTKHPVILGYEGILHPGWVCTDVFNTTDFAHMGRQPRRLALYCFTGKNGAP
jgi:hypothetical protein